MRTTLRMLSGQIEAIESQITEYVVFEQVDHQSLQKQRSRTEKIKDLLRRGSKNIAVTYLRSKRQLEELLLKRLNSQQALETVLGKIEQARTDVEVRLDMIIVSQTELTLCLRS